MTWLIAGVRLSHIFIADAVALLAPFYELKLAFVKSLSSLVISI
jgi:hypothetical protein